MKTSTANQVTHKAIEFLSFVQTIIVGTHQFAFSWIKLSSPVISCLIV